MPNPLFHVRLMAQLSRNYVSMSVSLPLGFGESRTKVARASRSEIHVLTQFREGRAIGRKRVEN